MDRLNINHSAAIDERRNHVRPLTADSKCASLCSGHYPASTTLTRWTHTSYTVREDKIALFLDPQQWSNLVGYPSISSVRDGPHSCQPRRRGFRNGDHLFGELFVIELLPLEAHQLARLLTNTGPRKRRFEVTWLSRFRRKRQGDWYLSPSGNQTHGSPSNRKC